MKQKKYLLSLVLLICSFTLYSQNDVNSVNKETSVEMAKPGTYQIVIIGKQQYGFPTDFLSEIEKHRLDEVDYTWDVSEKIHVIIPSRRTIKSKDFVKLEEIVYKIK